MADLADARRIALGLPGVEERASRGHAMWHVGAGRAFVWERPFTKADVRRDGPPPDGDLLGVRLADEVEKAALLAGEPELFLTISHFEGYAAVLLRLERADEARLREAVVEAWFTAAPPALTAAHPELA